MSTGGEGRRSDPTKASPRAATAVAELTQTAGAELPEPVRSPLEQQFGASFQHVRLHTDTAAARAAGAWHARALTVGAHIAFDHGEFQPATVEGRHLLAHELAHVVQQDGAAEPESDTTLSSTPDDHAEREAEGAADAVIEGRRVPALSALSTPAVQRNPPRELSGPPSVSRDPLNHAPDARATASLFGLDVIPEAGAMIDPDVPRDDQVWALVLQRLAPNNYRREWIEGVQRHLRATGGFRLDLWHLSGPGPHVHRPIRVAPDQALRMIDYLQAEIGPTVLRSSWLNLQPAQVELLELGREVDRIVAERTPAELTAAGFPSWYSPVIFRSDLQSFGAQLRAEAAARAALRTSTPAGNVSVANQGVVAAQDALFQAMVPAARAAEAIRLEPQLQADPGLRGLWRLPPTGPQTPASATGAPDMLIVALMRFARTQPGPLQAVNEGRTSEPPPTVALFQRFVRFTNRLVPAGEGDANLTNTPGDRNADPLPAQVAAWPELEPPNYDAALGTDHIFALDVSFSDVYEELANRFGGFGYRWEIIEVPAEDLSRIEQTAAHPPGSGSEPGWGEVWGARMARQGRYALADVSRSMGRDPSGRLVSLTAALGAPFVGATTAALANALLRSIGEVISTVFEMLTEPRTERHIVFPHAGLWVVRATCSPVLTDDSEFRRAASVAWVPVFARSPDLMGQLRMEQALGGQLQQEMKLTEVLLRLETQNECGPEWDELARTRDLLSVQLYGSGADLLTQQRRALRARLAEEGLPAATAATLERQVKALDMQLRLRAGRAGSLRGSERLQVVFVTDTGTVIHPLIEGVPAEQPGRASWYLSDITTPNSVDVTGRGAGRDEALMAGLVELFERHTGYGRGELQVFLRDRTNPSQGRIEHRRIEADATSMAMESIERITAVVTIAAMVAAPFTGGASLAILLPVGMVGAIPSAYRLADRAENATLRPDMQTLLDVVNIVGAGLGALGEGAGALRMVRLQRFAAITGLGTDGLTLIATSYSLLRQIDELPPDMPQGARRAAVMRIVAAELQTVGMMAAGRLIGHANAMEPQSRAPADEPGARGAEGAGGPHSISDPTAGTSRVYGPEAPRRTSSPEFEARLPDDLRGRVRVESDSSLQGGTTEVRYDLDAFGTIREVYIAHGEGTAPDLTGHATTARQLLALTAFGARLRTFYNRLRLALGSTAPPRPGTEAFNAQFEVPKLREWLSRRQEAAARGRIDAEQLAAERALYEDQIAYYEHTLDVFNRTGQAGAESSAVAARSRVQWTRERLRTRFGLGQGDLPESRPSGWRGEHEAAWLGYPQAEPNYQWRMDQPGNRLAYQRSPGAPADSPRRAFDAANGQFVTVPADISAASLDAVREGLPPPPADHHYRYYEATQSWELALNDGAADRGVIPLTLQEQVNAPGRYDFVPRSAGGGTLIRRPPYRTDVAVGATRPSDLLASPETRARYEELLNRRDAALRAREAARAAVPPEPDPGDAAAHGAWEELPAVREYLRLRNQVGSASRDIGTFAADAHVRRTWEGARRIHPPEGVALDVAGSASGDFDLVYQLTDGRMIVVEAKGGSGTLGWRRVAGERGVSAQQGTREYYLEIVSSMTGRGGSAATAAALLVAAGSSRVVYLHIESPISTAAAGQLTSEVGALRVNAFDVGRPGLRPATPAAVP